MADEDKANPQDAWDEFVAVFLDAVRPYVSPVLDWMERRLERLSRWMGCCNGTDT